MANRPMSESVQRAYDAGLVARAEGKGLDSLPAGYRAAKSLSAAWRKGWDAASAPVQTPSPPPIRTPQPVVVAQAAFLSVDAPLPEVYVRPVPVACRLCRCMKLENGSQAVVLDHTFNEVAVLKCRRCYGSFKLPIKYN